MEPLHPLFAGVDAGLVSRLASPANLRAFAPGALVLVEDDPEVAFFILVSGSVKVLYRSPEGLEVVVKLFRAPAVFGEMECLTGIPYLESVEALERSTAHVIGREQLIAALEASHALTFNLLGDLSARLCIAAQNERALAFHPVETRLASLLLTYLEFYGVPAEGGVKIRIPLSQDALANALGVARRSITRALKAWQDEDLVVKSGAHYLVRDPTRLEKVSDPALLRIGHRFRRRLTPAVPR